MRSVFESANLFISDGFLISWEEGPRCFGNNARVFCFHINDASSSQCNQLEASLGTHDSIMLCIALLNKVLRKDKKSTSLGIHCGFCGRLRYRLLEHAIKHTTPALSKQSSRSHTPQNRLTMDQSGQLSCQSTLPQDMNCCISALLPGVFAMSTTTTHDFWSGACQTDHHRSSQKSHPSLYQNLWLACLTHGDFHIPKDDESASVVGSGSIETFTKIFKNIQK